VPWERCRASTWSRTIQVRDGAGNAALFLRDVNPGTCGCTMRPTMIPTQRVAPLADGSLARYWGELLLIGEIDVEAWKLAGWQLGWITVPPTAQA
jgi:hypothetical protein